jgi:hypothetical protein
MHGKAGHSGRAKGRLTAMCGPIVLSFMGMLAFLMAALDATCRLSGWPLTTLSWSPLLFLVLGFALVALEAWQRDVGPPVAAPPDPGRT